MDQKKMYGIISIWIATAVSLIYWFVVLTGSGTGILSIEKMGNVKAYVILVALFALVFAGCYLVLSLIKTDFSISKKGTFAVFVVEVIAFLLLTVSHFGDNLVFQTWLLIPIYSIGVIVVLAVIAQESKANWILAAGLIVGIGVFWGVAVGAQNTLSEAGWFSSYSVHHTSAYIDPIYNVQRGLPFEGGLTEQYGHYALLLYLPLRVIGFNTRNIGIIMGLLSMATFVLCMSSFCMVVKSNTVRVITGIAGGCAGVMHALEEIYWQVFPHRLFFPALTIFLVTYFSRKGMNIKRYMIGSCVMLLAVLWNFESGFICALAWAVFSLVEYYQRERISNQKSFLSISAILGMVLFTVLGPFIIVNLYNLGCGGKLLGLVDFIGMLVNQEYLDLLRCELLWGNELYIHKIIVFLVCFCVGIIHNKIGGLEHKYVMANCMISTSVIGLGLFTYYINRSKAGDSIINLFVVMCLGFLLYECAGVIKANHKQGTLSFVQMTKVATGIYAILMLFICTTTGIKLYDGFERKYNTGTYNYSKFQRLTDEIKQVVPADTWAKGEGTTAIYMELGWDKQTREFLYMTAEDRETMRKQNSLLLICSFYSEVPAGYKLQQEFSYNELKYGYYTKEK